VFLTRPPLDVTSPPFADPWVLERFSASGTRVFSVATPTRGTVAMILGDRLVLTDDSVRSAIDGRELESTSVPPWSSARPGVSAGTAVERLRLVSAPRVDLPSAPQEWGLQTVDAAGTRARPFTTIADRASAPFLTATGDALFVTAGETTAALTRVRQVHRLGAELMSCELRDDSIVDPVVSAPFAMGSVAAYNGRSLMLVSADDECPVCLSHNDFNARPRLVVYDLGPNAPALSKRGWVAPRGTAGGSGRSY